MPARDPVPRNSPGGGGAPPDNRPFCERHRTVCSVWDKLKLGAPRAKRTACYTVEGKDHACFRTGTCAPWKVNATKTAIAKGLGVADSFEAIGFTFSEVADIHLENFVPLCLELEAGRHTEHPDTGPGLAIRLAAYEEFAGRIRQGRIPIRVGRAPTGGDLPPPGAPDPGGSRAGGGGAGGVNLMGSELLVPALLVVGLLFAGRMKG